MLPKGTVTKIIHEGVKCYAVIAHENEFGFVVRFPFSTTTSVQIIQKPVSKDECRKPYDAQTAIAFSLLRQMVGVRMESKVDTKPTTKLSLGNDEPVDPEDEED